MLPDPYNNAAFQMERNVRRVHEVVPKLFEYLWRTSNRSIDFDFPIPYHRMNMGKIPKDRFNTIGY